MTKTKATALRACSAHIHMVLCARWAKKMMGMKTQTRRRLLGVSVPLFVSVGEG